MESQKPKGNAPITRTTVFVQTENQAHEAWSILTDTNPKAASLLHRLAALVDAQNAGVIVVSNDTLAQMTGWCVRTIQRSTAALIKGQWIQRVQLSKTVGGYAVNASVAWAGFTSNKTDMAVFHAAVVVPQSDIPAAIKLRRLPVLYPPDEVAIPRETGGESGSQLQIPGTETSIKLKREPKDFTQVAVPLPCPSCGGSSQPDPEGTGASVCTVCGLVF